MKERKEKVNGAVPIMATVNQRNKITAIMDGSPVKWGAKTGAFWRAIAGDRTIAGACFDVHMLAIASGVAANEASGYREFTSGAAYEEYSRIFAVAAMIRGYASPVIFQEELWCARVEGLAKAKGKGKWTESGAGRVRWSVNYIRENAQRILNNLLTAPVLSGDNSWYDEAGLWADKVAGEYGITACQVAQVCAVCSPQCPWEKNKLYTRMAIQAILDGVALVV